MAGLHHLVRQHAERNPSAIAILAPGRAPLSYGGLYRHIEGVIATLNSLGIGRNDRVALVLPDGPELAVALVAIGSGATCAPLNPAFRASEFGFALADVRAAALVVPAGSASPAVDVARARGMPVLELSAATAGEAGISALSGPGRAHPAQGGFAGPDDTLLVLHTSGTAAQPKLVPLSHRNVVTSARDIAAVLELTATDRCLNVMPLIHIHGQSAVYASLAAGASVVCTAGFSAADFADALRAFEPTWYTAAPAIHRLVLAEALRRPVIPARPTLRFIRSASSAMPVQLVADMERAFGVPLIEAYGMTEAAPQIASNRLPPAVRKPGSVGRAAGPEVAIMDDGGNLLPPGASGEVVIRGANVTSGYEGEQGGNEAAFTRGWFRTGDTGHLDADGDLFITGRLKEIINRGGEKISPREVDDVLLAHPAVAEAVTFPVAHATLGEGVAAAVVLRAGVRATAQEIHQFAASRLAPFKLPQPVIITDAIPKGPTGKPQRIGLAERLGLAEIGGGRTRSAPPRTPVEEKICGILAGVLGLERIGVDDNFFQLGGHSLTATRAAARIAEVFHVELAVQGIFERPTAAALAEIVDAFRPHEQSRTIPRRQSNEPCALSFAQQRLWFLDQVERGNPAYNMQLALRLTGALDLAALEESLGEIRRRHESLRTTFIAVDGQPLQVINPAAPLRLAVIDLSRLAPAEREGEARRVAAERAGEPFHLARGPLLRTALIRLGAREHVLVLTLHHIVSDGWSNGVLAAELATLYRAFAAGQASPLPELPIQYADFALWQRRLMAETREREEQLGYWREQLRDVPPALELPLDRPRPAVQANRGARHETLLPRALAEGLKSVGEREGATLFMTSLAAFQALLFRYTGQADLTVGTAIANRTQAATENLIGFFANTLVMRADLSGDPPFRDFLGRVRTTALGAYAHQDLPFEKLVDELQPARQANRTPLFQVMFAFQNYPELPGELAAGLAVERLPVDSEAAKFDLTLYLTPTGRGLELAWQYDTDLFEAETIERMAGHFRTLVEGIVAEPGQQLSRLPLMSDADRRRLLTAGRDASAADPLCFNQVFEAQAQRTPDAVAVQSGDERMTYRGLNERANRLAHRLRQLGVKPETPVAVCLPRAINMPVALLGVLKSGGAYVPLNPEYPAERLAFMLADTRAPVLVTEEALKSCLPAHAAAVVCLDALPDTAAGDADRNPAGVATPASLAYVIYTSGSTGRPKGVTITHGNVRHYVRAMTAALGVTGSDRYLHTASFAFSSSIRQFLVPLSCGAAVVLASPDEIRDPLLLFQAIKKQGVSIIDVVPSYLRVLTHVLADMEAGSRATLLDNELRLVLSASETLHADLPRQWITGFRHPAQLVNMFGQTETTGIVTTYPIPPPADDAASPVPLGRAIPGTQVYVLDAAAGLVPPGVPGEIFIGGPGVGRGYLDEAATAERFVPDLFSGTAGARLYRTGDLGRLRADGNLEHLGRMDQQVKVRGFRIEPGEVEAALNAHPQVLESVVIAQDADTGGKRLVACVVRRNGGSRAPDPASCQSFAKTLRDFLKTKLPDYMMPATILELEALPRTPNGKVDRKALPALDGTTVEPAGAFAVPGLPAEEILAAIWADVLRLDRVGVDDNFFDLGGDSIVSLQMIDRANRAGLRLTPRQLFQHQTIAELARVAGAGANAPVSLEAARPEQPATPPAAVATDANAAAIRVTLDSMRAFGREALERAGLTPADAAVMTEVQIEASLRGQPTHNVGAIPRYARRLAAGATNPRPRIRVERETATSALVDGDNGPGQLVAVMAMELAIRKARESGVCVVGARHSNHFGAAGHYAWLAARESLIGLCTTNSALWLAPTGGVTPLFGTNPLAVGIPAARHQPIVLDVSMSVQAKGKVALHLAEGKPLAPGWILDRSGRPSIDAADLAAGLGVPIGGHKGYGLALVMEILSGVLTGAGFGEDHRRERLKRQDQPVDFGHFFMAIDPGLFMPLADFTARADRMIGQVKSAARAEGAGEILLPGEAEMRSRERNLREGVPILPAAWRALREHKAAAGLATELDVIPEGMPFTRADIEQTIPQRFEAVARRFADRLALTGGGQRWTYAELDARANRIAHAIVHVTSERAPRGAGAIAYLLEQSPEMVIATLAVLKAGKTYLAIHPRMPLKAQAEILKDIAPQLLLTSAALESRAREIAAGTCGVLTLEQIDDRYPETDPPAMTRPDDPSTIFYTSGTTRQAKGVVKSHRAVLHRAWLSAQYDAITPADRQSLLTHCSFSASESDMFGPLLQGASVHVFDIAARGLGAFREWLDEERVTLLHPPVLFFRRFLATLEGEPVFASVRIVALAGDVVLPADLQLWRRHFPPSCVVLHRFSITETALLTVARIDHQAALDCTVVDAGRPVPDKELVLVNEAGEPVAPGEIGELVVKSAYLADGYWHRPAETAAAFRTTGGATGERAYHTGDLGRFLDDGRFVFLGRRDHQVKIRGYRVDTREVEAALLQLDDVAETAVVVKRDEDEPRLVAFVVLKTAARWDAATLRSRLRGLLPEWKIPARFEPIASLPTTPTGKVDRQRLLEHAR